MGESRQVRRAQARRNDYWVLDRSGHLVPGKRPCRRQNAEGRDNVSANVIAARASRKRLSPRPAPRHPKGEKHAWQRKALKYAALRKLLGQERPTDSGTAS